MPPQSPLDTVVSDPAIVFRFADSFTNLLNKPKPDQVIYDPFDSRAHFDFTSSSLVLSPRPEFRLARVVLQSDATIACIMNSKVHLISLPAPSKSCLI